MTDTRDGRTYKTVTIGTQTWMAQNLNYKTEYSSHCYNDSATYCSKYGRLYSWGAAMDSVGTWSVNGEGCGFNKKCSPKHPARGVCPEGWHLPTRKEWETLFNAIGGLSNASTLKSTSGWTNDGNGTDAFSFSALPAGFRDYYGRSRSEGDYAYFWSSSEYDSGHASHMYLYYGTDFAKLTDTAHSMLYGYSVRCVKD